MLKSEFDRWINFFKPRSHHFDFGFSYALGGSVNLTVEISEADVVEVNESEVTHARASESFCRPASNSTDTYDGKMGLGERFESGKPIEAGNAAEAFKVRSHEREVRFSKRVGLLVGSRLLRVKSEERSWRGGNWVRRREARRSGHEGD